MNLQRCVHWTAAMMLVAASAALEAQVFPTRPVRIISPFGAGGGTDILARTMAQKLTEVWRQQVIVENRPGATGIIGAELVVRSPPDGHTMLLGNAATQAVNVSMFKKLPYHPLRDLACVTVVGRLPELLVVHPSLPVSSVKQLIALAKAKPGALDFGSAGVGSPPHLAGELFKSMAKIEMVHVPYKASPLALTDVMAGQITMYFSNMLTAVRLVRAGKLKALGTTGIKRSAVAPEIPTISEAGLLGYEEYIWYVVAVPAATPPATVTALNSAIVAVLKSREVSDVLTADGAEIIAGTPEQCTAFTQSEINRYAKVIRDARISAE